MGEVMSKIVGLFLLFWMITLPVVWVVATYESFTHPLDESVYGIGTAFSPFPN